MMKILKVSLLLITFFGFAGSALAQEANQAKGQNNYNVRFDHERDDNSVMANMAKIKQSGIGYRFGEGSTFGVTIKNGVKVGFNIRF